MRIEEFLANVVEFLYNGFSASADIFVPLRPQTKFRQNGIRATFRDNCKSPRSDVASSGRPFASYGKGLSGKFSGYEPDYAINVSFTMLMVNVSDENYSFTKFQRINGHGVNMSAISEISKLSWRAIENDYTLDQYEEELEKIRAKKRNYTPLQTAIGAGFACGGFCVQFGCDWMAFLYASIAAIVGMRLRQICNESGLNHYMGIAISAFVATMIAWATTFLPDSWTDTPWHPLLACALFIVPGVPLINFVDDMLDNYIQVGIVRAANTMIMMGAMAFGIAFAVKLCAIENFFPTISMVPHHSYWEYAGGSDRRYLGGMYS